MIDLSRRSFLKGIAVLSAGLVVNDFSLLFPKEVMPAEFEAFGDFRAMVQYNPTIGIDMVRYDILTKDTQLHVGLEIPIKDRINYINRYHKPMVAALKNEIQRRRIKKRDLLLLPYPPDYKHPDWFQKFCDKGEI